MRIAINCIQIDPRYAGGLNTYTLGLLDGFSAIGNGHRFHVYHTLANQALFARYRTHPNFELFCVDHASFSIRKSLSRAVLLSKSSKLYRLVCNTLFDSLREMMDTESEIIYTPTVVLQFFNSRRPNVLSMHDILHIRYPEFVSWPRRLSRSISYSLSARHADYFQASSDFVKRDILVHFPDISPDRVQVIEEGVNVADFSRRLDTASLGERYRLPERFLLYPAQLWPHKNHLTVLKALKRIEAREGVQIPLVMTGAKYGAARTIFGFTADNKMNYVHYLGKVPLKDLVKLYQRAAFLISASLYESNSLPVLEAAAAGTPIIASRIPPNEELTQTLQLNLFDPLEVDKLARLIYVLWNDVKTASAQVAHNRKNISVYSWENAARKYSNLFEKIRNA